jgi:uncharacterized membrane protein YfcA/uncharacterized membrane protein
MTRSPITPVLEPSAKQGTHGKQDDQLIRRAELVISYVLRGGVLLSAAIVVLGIAMTLYNNLMQRSHASDASQAFPHTVGSVLQGVLAGEAQAIIMLGLLLLLATPVIRVAVSIIAFGLERDWRYVGITSLVLLILIVSFLFGLGGGRSSTPEQVLAGQPVSYFALVFVGAMGAGLVGALVGLGGGIFIVPLLTLVFGLPIQVAIGASIVSVIATSSGAAAAYVRDHLTNLRIGMFLEIATTLGALCGALLVAVAPGQLLFVVFGMVLAISAVPLLVRIGEELPTGVTNDRWARLLALAGSYPDRRLGRNVSYAVTRVPLGVALMYVAGLISGLLGIGSGTFKVLAMDTAMRLPLKVSTTTSNFMIGVTAVASALIYFERGAIHPMVAAPIALGVLVGAVLGAKLLPRLSNSTVRKIFVPLLLFIAVEMLIRGLG